MSGLRSSLAAAFAMLLTACASAADPEPLPIAAAAPDSIRGVHNVGITVSDIDATLAFYQAAVPYELIEREMVPASAFPEEILTKRTGMIEVALVRTPTVFLRLFDVDPDSPAPPQRRPVIGPGYTHICFQSPSTAPKYHRFKEIGLDMLSRGDGPVDLGGYGVTYAYGFDPDGTMIEMEQLSPDVIAASGELGRKRTAHSVWISHVANVAADKPAMVEFYRTVLGYGPRREIPTTRRPTFDEVVDIDNVAISASWFDVGNLELEIWTYEEPRTPLDRSPKTLDALGYNSIVFEVTDLAGTVRRLTEGGLDVVSERVRVGDWEMFFLRDPEGNLIAFQQHSDSPERSIEDLRWIADAREAET